MSCKTHFACCAHVSRPSASDMQSSNVPQHMLHVRSCQFFVTMFLCRACANGCVRALTMYQFCFVGRRFALPRIAAHWIPIAAGKKIGLKKKCLENLEHVHMRSWGTCCARARRNCDRKKIVLPGRCRVKRSSTTHFLREKQIGEKKYIKLRTWRCLDDVLTSFVHSVWLQTRQENLTRQHAYMEQDNFMPKRWCSTTLKSPWNRNHRT